MALFDNNPLYENISSLANPITSGIGGLFKGMTPFGSSIPEGILTSDQEDKLRNQALFQGLLGTAATYLATPKNLNAGSPLPYIGKAFLGGMGASQDVIDRALLAQYRKQLSTTQDDGFSKINPLDVTPESLEAYIKGGKKDPSVLRRATTAEKPQGPIIVPAGSTVYDPTLGVAQFTAPKEDKNIGAVDPSKFTTESLGNFAQSGKFQDLKRIESPDEKLSFKDIYGGKPQLDVNGKPIFIPNLPGYPVLDANKRVVENVQLPQRADEKLTEGERTAGFLSTRLNNSLKQLQSVVGQEPSAAAPNLGAEATKFFTRSDYFKNLTTPESRQRVEAAQLDILDAALTLATGAAYTREQLESTRSTYFPQLGDKPGNIEDKSNRLQNLLGAAYAKAGRAAPQQSSTQPTTQSKTIVRTGKDKSGKKVIEYSDGSIGYGD
jgi:hypothetical protein